MGHPEVRWDQLDAGGLMGNKTSQILAAGFPDFGPAVITADNSVLVK